MIKGSCLFILAACSVGIRVSGANTIFAVDVSFNETEVLSVQSDDLTDLLVDLVQSDGAFTSLEEFTWNASLTYFAVPDTFSIESNLDGTVVIVSSSVTDLEEIFTGQNAGETSEAIEDWFLSEGASELAEIGAKLSAVSKITISDGNPGATTARLAENAFHRFGTEVDLSAWNFWDEDSKTIALGAAYYSNESEIQTAVGEISLKSDVIQIPVLVRFFDTFNLIELGFFEHTEIGGSDVYGGGGHVGVPFKLMDREESGTRWTLTPNLGIEGRGSEEVAFGNLVFHVALTSVFEQSVNEWLEVSLVNQLSTFETLTLEWEDLEFEPQIDQWILKNGIGVELKPILWCSFSTRFIDTRFLNEAAVDSFQDLEFELSSVRSGAIDASIYIRERFADGYDDRRI